MPIDRRETRQNVLALGADFCLFTIGFAFFDPFVVVPAFVKQFTGSDLMVGVLAALRVLTISLPQLWAASVLMARPRKRPLLMASSIGGRLPIAVLAVSTLLWAARWPWLVVAVLGLAVAAFYTSEGLNSVSWPALVGKVIPDEIRGRFLGFGQLFSSLAAIGAGYVVRTVLGQGLWSEPQRWAALYGCGFVALMLSVGSMFFIREQAEVVVSSKVDLGASIRAMVGFVRTSAWLRRFVTTQFVLGTAAATFSFFVVRARQLIPSGGPGGGSDQLLGLFVILQNLGGVAAALVCGQLIDRVGSWLAIRVVAVVQVAALATAILGGVPGAPQGFYLVAFLLLGFVGGSSWWSQSAYLLEMATDEQRPIYLAASGVLNSPTFLSAILVGAALEFWVAEAVFGVALALSAVAAALAWSLPRSRADISRNVSTQGRQEAKTRGSRGAEAEI
jgi:MFS family permease